MLKVSTLDDLAGGKSTVMVQVTQRQQPGDDSEVRGDPLECGTLR